ncbi:MAG: PBP1A family penicillin-binding protein [Desulfobulbaceae bacterium]|uniref:peptidoglycan glycosyltransferase n=1 Tax=Candidatus Desulfatifera sulfidica TaxID=2841691 RepID=A0A8J6N700_9BACT|nr:PBP1A family penicillin-binding protein [Candidatus Desulfatifera sulfidica]
MSPVRQKTESRGKPRNRPLRRKPYGEKHIIFFIFGIALLVNVFLGSLLLVSVLLDIPDLKTVAHYRPLQASEIVDRNGRIIERLFIENRTLVSLEKMPSLLPKAFVAAEDGRFYEHPGLDAWSVFRAAVVNLKKGRRSQGGSTITQQVARSLLLTPEKNYIRKLREAILAWRIDSLLTKDEILYIYLNQIYLGNGAYGVAAAAQEYFGKSVSQLNLGEMALLAGLPQAPSRYSPRRHLQRAQERQRYVLNRMAEDGYVSADEASEAFNRVPELRPIPVGSHGDHGYFSQLVRKQARKILGGSVNRAGVKIYTTLDQDEQALAVRAVRAGVMAVVERTPAVEQTGEVDGADDIEDVMVPQGALVSLDACTGRVRTLVGGVDFEESPFDRATQARRPAGSVFKPVVYAAALEQKWTPESLILDAPLTVTGQGDKPWRPKNFSDTYKGEMTLQQALVESSNVAAVRLLQETGVSRVRTLARNLELNEPIRANLSLALGATDVSLMNMSASYSPFVCNGRFVRPRLIDRIEDGNGRVLYASEQEGRRVVSRKTAESMQTMLEAVLHEGTGKRAAGLPGSSGGKTGTSDDSRDAWFIGFHGDRITGIWVGHDHNASLGIQENGGRTAAPIWRDYMGRVSGLDE